MLTRFKFIIKVIIVGLIVVVLFVLARVIVHHSYSSRDIIEKQVYEETQQKDNLQVPDPKEESNTQEYTQKKDFKEDIANPDSMLNEANSIYNGENLSTRQKDYLGEKYDSYASILEWVEAESYSICSGLGYPEPTDSTNITKYMDTYDQPSLSVSDVCNYDYVSFDGVLSAIGFYNNTSVLCAYNYPNNSEKFLIFIDFSKHRFSKESEYLGYNFGDSINVSLQPYSGVVREHDGWSVLFIKG